MPCSATRQRVTGHTNLFWVSVVHDTSLPKDASFVSNGETKMFRVEKEFVSVGE